MSGSSRPQLWNTIRHTIDERGEPGQFILSGSAAPAEDVTRHSGAGRVARVRMRPVTLAETGASSGEVRWSDLASGDPITGSAALDFRDLVSQAVRGGWPALLDRPDRTAAFFVRSYVDNLAAVDLPEAVGVRHDALAVRRVMASAARNLSTEASLRSIAADVAADGRNVDVKTVRAYLDALSRVFALEELPAWSVSLRSRSRLRSRARLHFCDPSLACAVLGLGVERLVANPEYFGLVFESLVIRDLRVYAEVEQARVLHYRDDTGLEVDSIVEWPDGTWAALEVKLGPSRVPDAEKALLKLRDERVDTTRVGEPRFLAVVTGVGRAYTLPSGVHVVPLSTVAY